MIIFSNASVFFLRAYGLSNHAGWTELVENQAATSASPDTNDDTEADDTDSEKEIEVTVE